MFRDVVAGCTRPRGMPLAKLTMKKELHGFLFLYMHVSCSYSYGAPIGGAPLQTVTFLKEQFLRIIKKKEEESLCDYD